LQLNLLRASYKCIPSLSSDFLFNSTDYFIIAIGFSLKSSVFTLYNRLGLIMACSVLPLENYVIWERIDFFYGTCDCASRVSNGETYWRVPTEGPTQVVIQTMRVGARKSLCFCNLRLWSVGCHQLLRSRWCYFPPG